MSELKYSKLKGRAEAEARLIARGVRPMATFSTLRADEVEVVKQVAAEHGLHTLVRACPSRPGYMEVSISLYPWILEVYVHVIRAQLPQEAKHVLFGLLYGYSLPDIDEYLRECKQS